MKVMVVDDCQTTRKILEFHLKSKGFDVVNAENGLDAIEKLSTETINLILTDLNMPYMDGLELVKTVKSDINLSQIPILMVTTEADPEEKEKALSAGADGYMIKPVTADDIYKNIKRIMKEIFSGQGGKDV
ncbi:MAG: response regulator [Nitrospirae bacterium]|nr:response regulator [Nitrospirota bacterium]